MYDSVVAKVNGQKIVRDFDSHFEAVKYAAQVKRDCIALGHNLTALTVNGTPWLTRGIPYTPNQKG